MIDGYEAFFRQYVDFMNKYSESDDGWEFLEEYFNWLEKLVEYEEKLDAVEDMEMNDAELAYYTQATLRIEKMLLSVSMA